MNNLVVAVENYLYNKKFNVASDLLIELIQLSSNGYGLVINLLYKLLSVMVLYTN